MNIVLPAGTAFGKFISLLVFLYLLPGSYGALAPGPYTITNVGLEVLKCTNTGLAFSNASCPASPKFITPPASPGYRSWNVQINGKHQSGNTLLQVATAWQSPSQLKCYKGQISVDAPASCSDTKVILSSTKFPARVPNTTYVPNPDPAYKHDWRAVPVTLNGASVPNTFKLVANVKASGCKRYLSVSGACGAPTVVLGSTPVSSQPSAALSFWRLEPTKIGTKTPSKPTIITVLRSSNDKGSARVRIRTPEAPGCSPITNYTITATPLAGGDTKTVTASGSASAASVSGLSWNERYTYTIKAENQCGSSGTYKYTETLAVSDPVTVGSRWGVCAVKADSKLTCLGGEQFIPNLSGNLNVPASYQKGHDVAQIVSNVVYSAALTHSGDLNLWGIQLSLNNGTGCIENAGLIACVPESYMSNVKYIHGYYNTLCITKENGDAKCSGVPVFGPPAVTPIAFSLFPNWENNTFSGENGIPGKVTGVLKMKTGSTGACIIYADNKLSCQGDPAAYAKGSAAVPLPDDYYEDIVDVGLSFFGACALKSNGNLACSSREDPKIRFATLPIPSGWDTGVAAVDCNNVGCCAYKSNGDFTCWGEICPDATIPAFPGLSSQPVNLTKICPATRAFPVALVNLGAFPNYLQGITKYTTRTFDGQPPIPHPIIGDVISWGMGGSQYSFLTKNGLHQAWGFLTPPRVINEFNLLTKVPKANYDYLF